MALDDIETQIEGEDTDSAELRVYELAFHIDAELPQEEAKNVYQVVKDAASSKGTVVAEGEAEKIQLAYTISRMDTTGRRDFNSAYFGWVAYETDTKGHESVLELAKGDARIIRFLDLRTTREAASHGAEMHEFYRKSPEAMDAGDEETTSDAELETALKEAGA